MAFGFADPSPLIALAMLTLVSRVGSDFTV